MLHVEVGRPITPPDNPAARKRQAVLVAALKTQAVSQSELHRRLIDVGENTAFSTVNRWCVGKADLTEIQLRGLLTLVGLPADWKPPPTAEQAARAKAKPRRANGS